MLCSMYDSVDSFDSEDYHEEISGWIRLFAKRLEVMQTEGASAQKEPRKAVSRKRQHAVQPPSVPFRSISTQVASTANQNTPPYKNQPAQQNTFRIQIDEYKEPFLKYFDRVLEHAAMLQVQGNTSALALSKLSSVRGSFKTWIGLKSLLPFLRLKSVKTADLDRIGDDISLHAEKPDIELDTLVLGAVVDGKASRLEGFLSKLKTLKSFRLREDGGECDPYYESEPHTLDDAISGLKHCLEELAIDQHKRAPEDEP
ncbi:unnamed protein product [Sphagnum balticum]